MGTIRDSVFIAERDRVQTAVDDDLNSGEFNCKL
jgi:hypothetical protein